MNIYELEEEYDDTFTITDSTTKAYDDITDLNELLDKLSYQFEEDTSLGVDRSDYFKIYCLRFLNIPKESFPDNILEHVNDENRDTFYNIMIAFSKRLYEYYGITIDMDNEDAIDILYALYYLFVVKPEQFIVDYLLYNHFYVETHNFVEWYKVQRINEKVSLDLFDDPVKQNKKSTELISQLAVKDLVTLTYSDRIEYFVKYAKEIFTDLNKFVGEEIFERINKFNPNLSYDFLDNSSRILSEFRISDEDVLVDKLMDRTFNVDYLLPYLSDKIITPFFKYLDNMVRIETQAADSSFSGSGGK
jgi:hypothetical protein